MQTRFLGAFLAAALVGLTPATAAAQATQTEPPSPLASAGQVNVEVNPIDCYWRTSAAAVHVGELFTVVLTCGVLDTALTTVVPDQSRLDPDVLQLQPFEVVVGTVGADVRTVSRRFFQYQYRVRYIGEEIGRDLSLPALTLTYRVQSRVQQDSAAVESRERQYILPAQTVRMLSLMPGGALDIREALPATFDDIRAQRFNASVLRIVALALYAFGGVVAIWALVRATRTRRARGAVAVRLASDAAVLAGVARELADVRRHRDSDGWSDALAARALGALRVAASYEVARPIAQIPAAGAAPTTGQLRVPGRWPRGGAVLLSGSATTVGLKRERTKAEASGHHGRGGRIAELETALTRMATAAYGRDHQTVDAAALDEALSDGSRALSALRREHGWLATRLRALSQSVADVRARAWAR